MNSEKENIIYSINTHFIAKVIYLPTASEYFIGDNENNYNSDIRYYLSKFFFEKGVFLNEKQTIIKYGIGAINMVHPKLFVYKTTQGESVYIEPFQKEKVFFIRKEDSEFFPFFFALTLKYFFEDKRIEQFPNFLNYQLKVNFDNDLEGFNNFLSAILNSYSPSVFLGINDFIEKATNSFFSGQLKKNICISKKGDLSGRFNNINLRTHLIWQVNKENNKKLKSLHDSLSEDFISEISFDMFKKHFKGYPQKEFINWLKSQYSLIFLFDKLVQYMDVELYKGNNSVSVSEIAKHFYWKGKPIKVENWYSVKSQKKETGQSQTQKKLQLIINSL